MFFFAMDKFGMARFCAEIFAMETEMSFAMGFWDGKKKFAMVVWDGKKTCLG